MTPGMVDLLRFLKDKVETLQRRSTILTTESRRLRMRSSHLRAHSIMRERVLQRLSCRRERAA